MSLRGFVLWFWGILVGSGVAAGATLAMLKAPEQPPAPSPIVPVALAVPLPPPALPVLAPVSAPPAHKIARPHPRPTVIRAGRSNHGARHATRVAERITVVPPVPPEYAPARFEPPAHAAQPGARHAGRAQARTHTVRLEARPGAGPRAYAYARAYRRYSYYTYSYPYSSGYPYRFSYFYRY